MSIKERAIAYATKNFPNETSDFPYMVVKVQEGLDRKGKKLPVLIFLYASKGGPDMATIAIRKKFLKKDFDKEVWLQEQKAKKKAEKKARKKALKLERESLLVSV